MVEWKKQNGKYEFVEVIFVDRRDMISANASLENLRQNMEMKSFAKEVLLEENYIKFMKSYKFMFWFQLLGILAGFLLPSAVIYILAKDIAFVAFGIAIGILWMIIWLIISLLMPQGRIYRKFSKWYRKRHAAMSELNEIF